MTEHWLEHAHGRILAGDDELDVLADYGWVQITAVEREAIDCFATAEWTSLRWSEVEKHCATLRQLLERLK